MVNAKYKDRLFCLLFGDEQYKENILFLYNALCNTKYENANDLQIYTIDRIAEFCAGQYGYSQTVDR